jgi:hypothetical protein
MVQKPELESSGVIVHDAMQFVKQWMVEQVDPAMDINSYVSSWILDLTGEY